MAPVFAQRQEKSYKRYIRAMKKADRKEQLVAEVHLNFADFLQQMANQVTETTEKTPSQLDQGNLLSFVSLVDTNDVSIMQNLVNVKETAATEKRVQE